MNMKKKTGDNHGELSQVTQMQIADFVERFHRPGDEAAEVKTFTNDVDCGTFTKDIEQCLHLIS